MTPNYWFIQHTAPHNAEFRKHLYAYDVVTDARAAAAALLQ